LALVAEGFRRAAALLWPPEPELVAITLLTLRVSGTATLLGLLLGVPLGALLAFRGFPGRSLALTATAAGMGLPPVVAGLAVSLLLWRGGPLGFLGLSYTPQAMIFAQVLIVLPIVTGLTVASLQAVDARLRLAILSLGAGRLQFLWLMMREARYPLLATVVAGFGRALSEVGASLMVGGNIQGQTRILTTATAMEVARGRFDLAIALSLVLLALSFLVAAGLTWLQRRGGEG